MSSTREVIAVQMARLSVVSGTMDITSLPDLCLDRILDHLPMMDLLTIVPLVCWRWYHSRASACKRRHTLLLLEYPDDVESVVKRATNMGLIIDYTVDEEGNSFGKPIEDLDHLEDSVLLLPNLGQRISLDQQSTGLLSLFTNITDLRLVQTTHLTASDLTKVHMILLRMAPNLHTLHLFLWVEQIDNDPVLGNDHDNDNNPPVDTGDEQQQQHLVYQNFSKIFELINTRMRPKLRKLYLNLHAPEDCPWARESVLANLSILDQLEEFGFRSFHLSSQSGPYDENEPLEALERYAAANPRLALIKLYNRMDLARAIRLPASVAASFTELAIDNWISHQDVGSSSRGDLRALTTFCQRFHSLRELTLPLTQTIAWEQMVKQLCGLRQLRHLILRSTFRERLPVTRHYSDQELEEYRRDLAMPSVIALSLFVSTRTSHDELAMLQLPTFFHNTQVVLLRHSTPHGCAQCHRDRLGNRRTTGEPQQQDLVHDDNNNDDGRLEANRVRMARCMELALRPFVQFGQLRQLVANHLPMNFTPYSTDLYYTREELAAI